MAIRISAVVCTHDRIGYLERAIESLLKQSLSADAYEVLVIDNASTDGTALFLAAQRSPRLRCFYEGEPGLSRARNRGLEEARGEFVAYLDDDAIARRDWLERIVARFDRGAGGAEGADGADGEGSRSEVACLGGRTLPVWEAPRPSWLSDEALGALAMVDWRPHAGFLSDGEFLVGANMAFRTGVLREAGGFPEHLGRIEKSLLSGEESHVIECLKERGYVPFYDPTVVVDHHVQRERVDRGWFLERARWQGVSAERARGVAGPRSVGERAAHVAGLVYRLARCPFRGLFFLLRGDVASAFDERCAAARRVAQLAVLLSARSGSGSGSGGPGRASR